MRSNPVSPQVSKFDGFLFASLGHEANGMRLSVLSALARLNLDAWDEAAKLARLRTDEAIQRLSALLAALPSGTSVRFDPLPVAAHLVALLPRPTSVKEQLWERISNRGKPYSRDVRFFIFYTIFVLFAITTEIVVVDHNFRQQVDKASTPPPGTALAKMPPASIEDEGPR